MSRKRLSSSKSQRRRSRSVDSKRATLEVARFVGISLSGGKNDKTCLTSLEYYPQHKKIFLKDIKDKIPNEDEISQDKYLLEILNKKDKSLKYVAIDSPLEMPYCLTHICPGVEKCKAATTKWHWAHYRKTKRKKKNLKLFTPYTERCVERYINYDLEERFEIPEALGANKAPLTARSLYLKNKIKKDLIEVFPKLTVWRIGSQLKLSKTDMRNYRHSVHGVECRSRFLQSLIERDILFIYHQDLQKLIDNPNAFDSMVCAFTAFLKHLGQCEKPPKGFPLQEGWVEFPLPNARFA